jgi:Sec-independent protein translocase protein TatA
MATAVQHPYHERRAGERRRIAYPGLLRGAEGMRVSWGGIWGGVLVAVGLLLLLAALGVAVGISAADPAQTDLSKLGTGAGIWAGVSLLLALFIGGMVSTRIGAISDGTTGFFEGALVWVVSVLLMAYLATTGISSLAGGAFSMVGGAKEAVGSVMGSNDPQAMKEQAQQKAQELKDKLPQLQQKAEEVKPTVSKAAWITFGALVLSLLAAVLGAMAGRRRHSEMRGQPTSTGT